MFLLPFMVQLSAIVLSSWWTPLFLLSLHLAPRRTTAYHGPPLTPQTRAKVASSIAKGERRAQERLVQRRTLCDRCQRPPVQCVCSALPVPKLSTHHTDILILQHPGEFRRKTFSTVPLIPLVLEPVQIAVGHSFDPEMVRPIQEAIQRGQRLLLLFPGPDSLALDDFNDQQVAELLQPPPNASIPNKIHNNNDPESLPPPRNLLILIDGTWTQARRMARHSPKLVEVCQQVQFTSHSTSIYDVIRQEPEPHCLSTLEACAQTLLLLEPNHADTQLAAQHLHQALAHLVEIQLRHSTQSLPRYVGRADKFRKKEQRRLALEREFVAGTTTSRGRIANEDSQQPQSRRLQDLGQGFHLRSLSVEDADYVNATWAHASPKSWGMIRQLLWEEGKQDGNLTCCLGIEYDQEATSSRTSRVDSEHAGTIANQNESDNNDTIEPQSTLSQQQQPQAQLVACLVRYPNGALGMLHVDQAYRRRGLGTLLLSYAMEQLQQHDQPLFAFILDGNAASQGIFTKMGWIPDNPRAKRGTGRRRAPRKWIYPTRPVDGEAKVEPKSKD
uniref:tRNA-uridine aminocarboxypropyltransferase n=1 Tax=Entomoneis paludosa TaxID=265537 RepID=A0A7S2YAD0_9STRA